MNKVDKAAAKAWSYSRGNIPHGTYARECIESHIEGQSHAYPIARKEGFMEAVELLKIRIESGVITYDQVWAFKAASNYLLEQWTKQNQNVESRDVGNGTPSIYGPG